MNSLSLYTFNPKIQSLRFSIKPSFIQTQSLLRSYYNNMICNEYKDQTIEFISILSI